jgi:hypothetical protein
MTAGAARVAAFIAIIVLTACNDGLIYSEWTSINLASARINADPATPVAIKLGFDRNVVAVAPPIGGTAEQSSTATIAGSRPPGTSPTTADGTSATCESASASKGEAVSQFSTFSVNVSTPFVGPGAGNSAEPPDRRHTWIHSRFASGGAALAIACAPHVAAAIMGLAGNPVTADKLTPEAIQRRDAIYQAIDQIDDGTARRLAEMPPTPMDQAMRNVVATVDPDNQRGTNAARAREVLRAWVPELSVSSYAAWETALGV